MSATAARPAPAEAGFAFGATPMGKLTSLRPQIGTLAPRIARQTDAEGHAPGVEPWRRWYNLARWKALRLATFARDLFTCQWDGCGRVEGNTSLLVADHREPHRGDPALFWDPANVWTLCKTCHDREKQRLERRARP